MKRRIRLALTIVLSLTALAAGGIGSVTPQLANAATGVFITGLVSPTVGPHCCVLYGDDQFLQGGDMMSYSGNYDLRFQSDGNLVIYKYSDSNGASSPQWWTGKQPITIAVVVHER